MPKEFLTRVDDLVLPPTGPSALHKIYLACATGRVLLIFVRFCRAAFHVAFACQVPDFDFSFLVFLRLGLARFISIIYNLSRTPSTARRPHTDQMEDRYYGKYDIYQPIANCEPKMRPLSHCCTAPRNPVARLLAVRPARFALLSVLPCSLFARSR
jgi:hypothetical protein